MTAEAAAATAKFRAVFKQTTVFAGIMTLDGTVIDINRLSLEACGYRAEDVLGKMFWETGWWQTVRNRKIKFEPQHRRLHKELPIQRHFLGRRH